MRQRLVVIGDRLLVDAGAEAPGSIGVGELPQTTEQSLRDAPAEQQTLWRVDPGHRALEQGELVLGLACGHDGQLGLTAGAIRDAMSGERTDEAPRCGRRARQGAELHQALVQLAWRRVHRERTDELQRRGPQGLHAGGRLDVLVEREHAREDACDVAVDERRPFAVGDRRDRARRVRPDPRNRAQRCRRPGQCAVMRGHDLARAVPQVARARVVPEAGPRCEDIVERRVGERAHRRKLRHPALPVRDHRRDARLL